MKKKHCLSLFIDFSKAFDTLSHSKLIETLERNGIRGNCLNWFKSYLRYRSYRVKIEDKLSEKVVSQHGVPQGSKLGPILYLLYANDMINQLKNSTTFAYADDTAVIVSHKNIKTATEIMQDQLNIVGKWCHDNGLVINATKTKIMHIRPPHFKNSNITIKFHDTDCLHKINIINNNHDTCNTLIELVDTYKYLGVYVDHHFKWKTQVENVQKKLRKTEGKYCCRSSRKRFVYKKVVTS